MTDHERCVRSIGIVGQRMRQKLMVRVFPQQSIQQRGMARVARVKVHTLTTRHRLVRKATDEAVPRVLVDVGKQIEVDSCQSSSSPLTRSCSRGIETAEAT